MSFAENLKYALDLRNLQVKELASKTRISKNTIDNYLSGQKSLPNIENGFKIAQALDVSMEYLVTGDFSLSKNAKFSERILKTQKSVPEENDITNILADLKRLKKSDLDSIKNIIKSLAMR